MLQNFLADDTFADLEAAQGIVDVEYTDTTHYPLTWVLTPGANLRIKLEYRPDVIAAAAARAMVDRLVAVLPSWPAASTTPPAPSTARRRGPWAARKPTSATTTIAELLAGRPGCLRTTARWSSVRRS